MKNQRDKLQQYQKKITVITSREHEIARECLKNGNKQKALLALRRKKYQETLLARTDQQLAQLEALTSDVEFALVQKDVVYGLQQGTAVLKQIHREMGGLEKVELIMGESEEAQAYQKVVICYYTTCEFHDADITQEISEMLGNKMSNQDEDEVEEELEAMEREVVGVSSLPDAPTSVREQMPDVPEETPEQRAKRRRKERAAEQQSSEPIAA